MGNKCCKNNDDEVDDIRRSSKHPTEIRPGDSMIEQNKNEDSAKKVNGIGDSMLNSAAESSMLSSTNSISLNKLNGVANGLADRSSFHFEDGDTERQQS